MRGRWISVESERVRGRRAQKGKMARRSWIAHVSVLGGPRVSPLTLALCVCRGRSMDTLSPFARWQETCMTDSLLTTPPRRRRHNLPRPSPGSLLSRARSSIHLTASSEPPEPVRAPMSSRSGRTHEYAQVSASVQAAQVRDVDLYQFFASRETPLTKSFLFIKPIFPRPPLCVSFSQSRPYSRFRYHQQHLLRPGAAARRRCISYEQVADDQSDVTTRRE